MAAFSLLSSLGSGWKYTTHPQEGGTTTTTDHTRIGLVSVLNCNRVKQIQMQQLDQLLAVAI
jgi:hypothetical protein